MLISKVKKKKMRKRREKGERAGKDLRGGGEDFGQGGGILEGVAEELRRRRRSRIFRFHGFARRKLRRTPSCARAFWPTGRVKQQHPSAAAAAPSQSQNSSSNWTFFRAELGILYLFLCVFLHDPGLVCLSAI